MITDEVTYYLPVKVDLVFLHIVSFEAGIVPQQTRHSAPEAGQPGLGRVVEVHDLGQEGGRRVAHSSR